MNYDTLDYLIPPVRKRCEKEEFTKEHINCDVRRPKRLSTKLANDITQLSHSPKADVGTPCSGGLKRNTNKLLLEKFSITNFIKKKASKNNIITRSKNQKVPVSSANVIKITVVPITTQTQTSKIVLKRNQIIKKIHKTVSNTNSSQKKIRLCSSRHRREYHGIRETSSADLLKPRWERNTKYEKLSLNRMTYAKTVINSIDMNHKDRHERDIPNEIRISQRNTRKSYKTLKEGCTCNDTKINDVLDDMNSRINRVTVTGRLGINENDQYILNCAATVNNEPIKTYISQQNLNSGCIDQCENNGGINKTTRATQADMNICFATDSVKTSTVDNKNVQCRCRNVRDVATTISECKLLGCTERKSPLIVISVYPAKDTLENMQDLADIIQINHLQEPQQSEKCRDIEHKLDSRVNQKYVTRSPEKKTASPPFKTVDKEKLENRSLAKRSPSPPNKVENKSLRSRSRSPPVKNFNFNRVENKSPRSTSRPPPVKHLNNNKVENKFLRSRSRTPPVKNTTTVRDKNKHRLIKQLSQKSVRSPEQQPRVLAQKDRTNRNSVIINEAQASKLYPFKNVCDGIKETSAKKNKIKKAIVDSYTQKILMPEKDKETAMLVDGKPKSNASSVTINIDGDNERYRVLFLRDKLNTDLSIRKTFKIHKQKPLNDLKKIELGKEDSMKNCRLIAKDATPGKKLEKLSNRLNNSQAATDKRTSRFKIRDSIEMRHWREDGNEEYDTNTNKNYEPTVKIMHKTRGKYGNDDDFSAPVKHYRGDQCCVPNPTLRDQEIRDLLGISKPRSGKSEFVQEVLPELIGLKLHYMLQPDKCAKSSSSILDQSYCSSTETQNKLNTNNQPKLVSTWTQCRESTTNSYKQMVLNRNIQVFLEVEQFTKQKPIMLSRKQYERVKKTIQKKASIRINQEKRRLINSTKCSLVSLGEIRKTMKQQTPKVKISRTIQAECNSMRKQKNEDKTKHDNEEDTPLTILHVAEKTTKDDVNLAASPRQVVSSMEIRYASLAHLRHVTFSSCNVKGKSGSLLCLREKDCPSIQTIFKGHKKCVTPNLGTSVYSLYTDEEVNLSDNQYTLYAHDEKPKKPFLRRLMSCLVMRSNRASEAILPRQHDPPSAMNSFDSYYINTSLGAIELTSSLYDTSASFYSNHTILPIARIKRGFLSSVRGFLTNLKSR